MRHITYSAIGCLLIYLFASFVALSLNVYEWRSEGRLFVSIGWLAWCFSMFMINDLETSFKRK